MMSVLIVLAGLPGSGKSSIARALAKEIGAIWLRIDSIEQAIRDSGVVPGAVDDAGYRAAYAVAEDNLRLGRDIIADAVNDCSLARNGWRDASFRAGAEIIEVEIICTDFDEHRRRIETRDIGIPGLNPLDWQSVIGRNYEPWDRDHLTIDTTERSIEDCTGLIRAALDTRAC